MILNLMKMTNNSAKPKITQRKETLITFAILIAALVAAFLVSSLVVSVGFVNGPSMEDTLHDGDVIIIWKLNREVQRGDVVVCRLPELTRGTVVKRIAACPGDRVRITKSGEIFVNSELIAEDLSGKYAETELTVPEGEYFLLGDNLGASVDSRDEGFGTVNKKSIEGRVVFRLFPDMTDIKIQ